MPEERVFAARLMRLGLADELGATIGRVEDVVVAPAHGLSSPRVLGFVANVQRRRIFVSAGRAASIGPGGITLRGGTVDLRHFRSRDGEILLSALFGRGLGAEVVTDVALAPGDRGEWEVVSVALGARRALYQRTRRVVDWQDARELFDGGPVGAQLAALRDMNPTDIAATVHALPPGRRALIAKAVPDEQLADILEELPEDEQVRLLEDLDLARAADVVEEMEPDDAADLLAAMPAERRVQFLTALEPEDAAAISRLLRYDATTAGGLMTPEPIILAPDVSVAEALARLRDPDEPPAIAAQAFVCEPPTDTPTGRFLGMVGFQRLLREPPAHPVASCISGADFVRPELDEREVAERLAAYNLIAVAVCDSTGRLLGAVTVDDVLDRVLPVGWRKRRR